MSEVAENRHIDMTYIPDRGFDNMRVTLDLDNVKLEKAEGKAILLKKAYPKALVRYRISSSGKGCHVELVDYVGYLNEEMSYNIRRLMGDHEARTRIDLSRGRNGNIMLPTQVLFNMKVKDGEKFRAGAWRICQRQ